jgi:hypothetical protein
LTCKNFSARCGLIVSTNLLSAYLFHISTSETVFLCKGKEKLQWAPLF